MKTEMVVEVVADIDPKGIFRALYLGETCEPTFEDVESWEEIIQRNIGYYLHPVAKTINPEEMKGLKQTVAGLERAVEIFKQKIEEHME